MQSVIVISSTGHDIRIIVLQIWERQLNNTYWALKTAGMIDKKHAYVTTLLGAGDSYLTAEEEKFLASMNAIVIDVDISQTFNDSSLNLTDWPSN